MIELSGYHASGLNLVKKSQLVALLEEFIFQLDQITRDCGLLLIDSVLMIKACSRFNQVRSVASESDFDFLSVSNQLSL